MGKTMFVEVGDALVVVLKMAKCLYEKHGEVCGAENLAMVKESFRVVEDLIVNEYGEDESGLR